MSRFWLRLLIGLVTVVLALLIVAAGTIYAVTEMWIGENYQVGVQPVAIPIDTAAVAEGRRLAVTRGCVDCHGQDLGGKAVVDDPAVGTVHGSNLTSGRGGVASLYDDPALQRAIRHGVGADGRPLVVMPSREYFPMSDADLGRLIAYIKSAPPVDRVPEPISIGPVGRLLLVIGEIKLAARVIDHTASRPPAPPPGPTVEYGAYLAVGCTGCHGETFSGGRIPGVPPEWPPASNITPDMGSGIGKWRMEDFEKAMRQGARPEGLMINPVMPWRQFAEFSDDEIESLWRYLRTVPAQAYGNR